MRIGSWLKALRVVSTLGMGEILSPPRSCRASVEGCPRARFCGSALIPQWTRAFEAWVGVGRNTFNRILSPSQGLLANLTLAETSHCKLGLRGPVETPARVPVLTCKPRNTTWDSNCRPATEPIDHRGLHRHHGTGSGWTHCASILRSAG